MALSMEQIVAASGGDMVGGQLLARVDDKNVILGELRSGKFELTPAGEAFTLKHDKPVMLAQPRRHTPSRLSRTTEFADAAAAVEGTALDNPPEPSEE